jgi:outer membrane protein OmpA-like peptidoglycan-associated protein
MKKIPILLLLILVALPGFSEVFRFEYWKDEKYKIVTTVDEKVYINGTFSHQADILNKISIRVSDVDEGSGLLQATFQTSERAAGSSEVYQWSQDYTSIFWRDEYGRYDIEPRYYMPVVRNVPTFPERDIQPKQTWSAQGSEAHDFRKNFNIAEPYTFPIYVTYTYTGKESREGRTLDVISIKYSVFHRTAQIPPGSSLFPVRISGYSEQVLYWDNKLGRPRGYDEQFEFVIDLSTGDNVTYKGTAHGDVIPSPHLDREEEAEKIREKLSEKGVENTDVGANEEGVTITLENIQFLPDSAILREEEKEKLGTIAEILMEYPERDILVEGHTALAGTPQGRQQLSEERARAVADYLLSLGVKEAEHLITRGMAAREPIAENTTAAGMRKNRRVEITILEN